MNSFNHPFIFFGSPTFAEVLLADLLQSGFVPRAVVCSADKPFGRKQIMTPPPVKELALAHHIPVIQPSQKPQRQDFSDYSDVLFGLVAAYAYIIPQEVISLFPKGLVGVHPSLLPFHRGASPIQTALLHQDPITGVSLYCIDDQMDHGPVISQQEVIISAQDTYTTLEEKLAHVGAKLVADTIPQWASGSLVAHEQDHAHATYTQKFITEDGRVDLNLDLPQTIARKIKALAHDPGVFTYIDGKRIKLLEITEGPTEYVITKIIPEGKNEQLAHIVLKK